jgi:glycosyltransferase involved in cell wall biosynthesis
MLKSLITIIIPTYKRADKLIEAIKSVLHQTYESWELIIVDDNECVSSDRISTDNIMQKYKDNPKIIYIKHDDNKGACAARNTGINNANGKYVAFLDDDDLWFNDKLELQINLLERNKNLGFVYCNLINIDIVEKEINYNMKNKIFYDLLKRGAGICTSALLIKKDLLVDINGFDEALPSYQDYDLLLRLSLKCECDYVDKPLLTYEAGKGGISRNYEAKLIGKELILKKYKKYLTEKKMKRYYGEHLKLLADYAILSGKRFKSITHYVDSITNNPFLLKSYIKLIIVIVGGKRLYNLLTSDFRKLKTNISRCFHY